MAVAADFHRDFLIPEGIVPPVPESRSGELRYYILSGKRLSRAVTILYHIFAEKSTPALSLILTE